MLKSRQSCGRNVARPLIRNTTRWSSSFAMLNRVFEIEQLIDKTYMDLASFLPRPTEKLLLKTLLKQLQKLESISRNLHYGKTTIAECRVLFDHILERHPNAGLEHYPGTGSNTFTHLPYFEIGIANFLNGLPLSKKQDAVAVLMPTSDIEEM